MHRGRRRFEGNGGGEVTRQHRCLGVSRGQRRVRYRPVAACSVARRKRVLDRLAHEEPWTNPARPPPEVLEEPGADGRVDGVEDLIDTRARSGSDAADVERRAAASGELQRAPGPIIESSKSLADHLPDRARCLGRLRRADRPAAVIAAHVSGIEQVLPGLGQEEHVAGAELRELVDHGLQ